MQDYSNPSELVMELLHSCTGLLKYNFYLYLTSTHIIEVEYVVKSVIALFIESYPGKSLLHYIYDITIITQIMIALSQKYNCDW